MAQVQGQGSEAPALQESVKQIDWNERLIKAVLDNDDAAISDTLTTTRIQIDRSHHFNVLVEVYSYNTVMGMAMNTGGSAAAKLSIFRDGKVIRERGKKLILPNTPKVLPPSLADGNFDSCEFVKQLLSFFERNGAIEFTADVNDALCELLRGLPDSKAALEMWIDSEHVNHSYVPPGAKDTLLMRLLDVGGEDGVDLAARLLGKNLTSEYVNHQNEHGKSALLLLSGKYSFPGNRKYGINDYRRTTENIPDSKMKAVASQLLQAGADPHLVTPIHSQSALHFASYNNNHALVKLLCEAEVDVDLVDKQGQTSLYYTVFGGCIESMVLLIQAHVDTSKADKAGRQSMLKYAEKAFRNRDDRVVKALRNNFTQEPRFFEKDKLLEVKKLASGNFGITYSGNLMVAGDKWVAVCMPVVMKVSKAETGADEWHELTTLQNLPRSAYSVSLLGVCTDFGEDSRTALIVPFKEGGSLRSHLDGRKTPLPLKRAVEFARDMARGVLHLHKNGFKHNDISARNFLLSEKESESSGSVGVQRLTITDFGLTRKTSYQMPAGSLMPWRWVAPETLSSRATNTSTLSDVWMLGIAFWELLGVKAPPFFNLASPGLLFAEYCSGKVPLTFPTHTDERFRAIVFDCCKINPRKRPSAEEVADRLAALLSELRREPEPQKNVDTSEESKLADEDSSFNAEYDGYDGGNGEDYYGEIDDYGTMEPLLSDDDDVEDDTSSPQTDREADVTPDTEESSAQDQNYDVEDVVKEVTPPLTSGADAGEPRIEDLLSQIGQLRAELSKERAERETLKVQLAEERKRSAQFEDELKALREGS